MDWIIILALIGFVLSLYAWHVERKVRMVKTYSPVCDISEHVSCSKAFSSIYGKHFGVSNGTYGLIFYVVIIALALMNMQTGIVVLSLISVIGSVYLASVLYIKLKNFCIICTGIYLINVLIFILTLMQT